MLISLHYSGERRTRCTFIFLFVSLGRRYRCSVTASTRSRTTSMPPIVTNSWPPCAPTMTTIGSTTPSLSIRPTSTTRLWKFHVRSTTHNSRRRCVWFLHLHWLMSLLSPAPLIRDCIETCALFDLIDRLIGKRHCNSWNLLYWSMFLPKSKRTQVVF